MKRTLRSALFALLAMAVPLAISPPVAAQDRMATAERWEWLKGTHWYVPKDYLPAAVSMPAFPAPIIVNDQTVYRIDGYANGYFWGPTAVSYYGNLAQPGPPSCLFLVGSVTPEGKLHLTFSPADPNGAAETTSGIGAMVKQAGEWTMENQMSSLAGGKTVLAHWAYMYQCKRGEHCFSTLPGVKISIPEFLGNCEPAQR